MGSRRTTNWVKESNRINCFIDRSATRFELFKIKISEFRIPLTPMEWSMIWIALFQLKSYFSDSRVCISKRKGFRWLEIYSNLKFFRNFLFQSMEWALTIFIDGYWGRPDLFFWFLSLFTVQRRSRFVKCIRTFYQKWYRASGCLTSNKSNNKILPPLRHILGWAVIWERRFMLYRLISYHGWGVKNRRGFLFLIKEKKGIRILN